MQGLVNYSSSDDESDNSTHETSVMNPPVINQSSNVASVSYQQKRVHEEDDTQNANSAKPAPQKKEKPKKPKKSMKEIMKTMLKLSDEDIKELYDDNDESEINKKKAMINKREQANSQSGLFAILPTPIHEKDDMIMANNNARREDLENTRQTKPSAVSRSINSKLTFEDLQKAKAKVFSSNNYTNTNMDVDIDSVPSSIPQTESVPTQQYTPQQYQAYLNQVQMTPTISMFFIPEQSSFLAEADLKAQYGEEAYKNFDKDTKEALLSGNFSAVDQNDIHDPTSRPTEVESFGNYTGFEFTGNSDVMVARVAKQKHQITTLAQDAITKMKDLEYMKNQQHMKRKQTRAKYGW